MDRVRTHDKSNASRPGCNGRWPQFRDQPQDVGEQVSGNCDLGHLERDIAPVANDLRADLDQLLLQSHQRPQSACRSVTSAVTMNDERDQL